MTISGKLAPGTQDRFHPDPERSYTLAAPYYHDPAVFAREQEAIFFRSWRCLAHASELAEPGAYVTADLAGQGVFVLRGPDGTLRAFYNVCQHRAHELLEGKGTIKAVITCPYHGWAYGPDGRLRAARHSEAVPGFRKEDVCLQAVRVEVFCSFVFVNLDTEAAALADQAGDLAEELNRACPRIEELRCAADSAFDLAANWKTVADNFLECYHCPVGHEAFAELVDMETYKVTTHGIWSHHVAAAGPAANSAYEYGGGGPDGFAAFYLWPDVAFIVLPGVAGLGTFLMAPVGPERTRQVFTLYTPSGALDGPARAALDYFKNVLGPEDVALVESVQRGLHSRGYRQGRFVVDPARGPFSEHGVHHFHGLVLRALGEP